MNDGTASQDVRVEIISGSLPGVTILKVCGPLTIRNFFDFQNLTRTERSPVLLVDLSEVPFIDSAALGSLLGLHVSCGRNNRKYAVVSPNDRLRTMFTVAGVNDVVVTFPSVAAAEAALG